MINLQSELEEILKEIEFFRIEINKKINTPLGALFLRNNLIDFRNKVYKFSNKLPEYNLDYYRISIQNKLMDLFTEYNNFNPYQFGGLLASLTLLREHIKTTPIPKKENNYKTKKLFISHSSKDYEIIKKFVDLLMKIGFNDGNLFCSSVSGVDIPLGNGDIYDYLKEQFLNHDLFVVYCLSENYYKSPACLNEMGATWVKNLKYQSILLPEFKFEDIKGAVNSNQISFTINDHIKLIEFIDNLVVEFELREISNTLMNNLIDEFKKEISLLT